MPAAKDTLLWGTANPEGLSDTYNWIYLNSTDIKDVVQQIEACSQRGEPIPVHVEHTGVPVGRVVSAWEHGGKLECVLRLDNQVFKGTLGASWSATGCARISPWGTP